MDKHVDPRLLEFLRDPASYPHHPRELREVHTHASLVFLVPPLVYKVKKPVDFGFLDFSTLEKRHHFCQREVELNSRLCPGIYQGVETITLEDGNHTFGGAGRVVEVAVKMRFMEPSGFLDARIKAGADGQEELERVAQKLADFYQNQPSTPEIARWGEVEQLRISTDENFSQTAEFVGQTLSQAAFDAIRAFTENTYQRRRGLFDKRVADGWIRDCHGDLHLDHIHLAGDALHIYDCIEFNDRFRHLDVASDVAFLAMDLDYHGRPDLARFIVTRLAGLLGDPGLAGPMDFYKCYRAYVRGKVESLHSVAEIADAPEREAAAARARRYFQLALQYAVCGSRPVALVFMGRVASGKSTIAAAVARELGWRLLSSDERRKSLAGVPLHERGDAGSRQILYAPGMTDATYESLIHDARETLRSGHGVILDATFSKRHIRDRLRESIGDQDLRWIITEVDDATAVERLRQRAQQQDVVSDARAEDHAFLNAEFEPAEDLNDCNKQTLKTNVDSRDVLRNLLVSMAISD